MPHLVNFILNTILGLTNCNVTITAEVFELLSLRSQRRLTDVSPSFIQFNESQSLFIIVKGNKYSESTEGVGYFISLGT